MGIAGLSECECGRAGRACLRIRDFDTSSSALPTLGATDVVEFAPLAWCR